MSEQSYDNYFNKSPISIGEDTSNFESVNPKRSPKSNNEVDEDNTFDEIHLKNKSYSFHKWALLIITLISIIVFLFSLVLAFVKGHIMVFDFEYDYDKSGKSSQYFPLLTNLVSISIIVLFKLICYLGLGFVILKNRPIDYRISFFIITTLSKNLVVVQFFTVAIYALGYLETTYHTYAWLIIILCISGLSIVLIILSYYKIKAKKNLSYLANFSLFAQISIVFSFMSYIFLFTLINTVAYTTNGGYFSPEENDIKNGLSISANVVYCLTAVLLITYYKDVIYAMTFMVIEIGYLSKSSQLTSAEIITAIVLLAFIFLGIVMAIFQNGKSTFGYEINEDVDQLLEKSEKKHRATEVM